MTRPSSGENVRHPQAGAGEGSGMRPRIAASTPEEPPPVITAQPKGGFVLLDVERVRKTDLRGPEQWRRELNLPGETPAALPVLPVLLGGVPRGRAGRRARLDDPMPHIAWAVRAGQEAGLAAVSQAAGPGSLAGFRSGATGPLPEEGRLKSPPRYWLLGRALALPLAWCRRYQSSHGPASSPRSCPPARSVSMRRAALAVCLSPSSLMRTGTALNVLCV